MTMHVRPSSLDRAATAAPKRDIFRVVGVVAALASASIINLSIVLVFAFSLSAFIVIGAVLALPLFVYAYLTCGAGADDGVLS